MDYSQFAVDCGKRIADMLGDEADFSAVKKSLAEIANIAVPDIRSIVLENFQPTAAGAFEDAYREMLNADVAPLATICANAITEQLKSSVYQNMAGQWADVLLKSIQALPIEEFEIRQEIPAEEVQEALADVKSCLPEEAADAVDLKLKADEQPSGRIPWKTVMEIITFIICVLGFIKDCLPDKHEQHAESANSAIIENEEMTIELHEKEIALMQEILDCLKNQNEVVVETQDASVNALEVAQEGFESAIDVTDLPDDSPEQETLDEACGTEN